MNLSKTITSLKMDLGIYTIALPFDNTDEVFRDVLKTKTIRIFSIYQPNTVRVPVNVLDLKKLEDNNEKCTYLLPDVFNGKEILYVKRVDYDVINPENVGYYGGLPVNGSSLQSLIIANAAAHVSNQILPSMTFEYTYPRRLTLYNAIKSHDLILEIALEHDENIASIPPTCAESFERLALLDLKTFLYNTLKHYTEIPSAFGNINLKIDEWSNAESERTQLLETWSNVYHMDIMPFMDF